MIWGYPYFWKHPIRKHTRRRGTRTTTTTSSTQREQQQRQPCTILCHHCDPSLSHWFGKQRGDGKATNRVNIPRHVSRISIQRGNAVDLVSFFNETMGKPWNLLVDVRFLCTLPKTNIFALESRPPKRKGSSSNHPFSGVNSLLVSRRVDLGKL